MTAPRIIVLAGPNGGGRLYSEEPQMSDKSSAEWADHQIRTQRALAAVQRAVRQAVLEEARLGRSVSTWRDGHVVWVSPEENLKRAGDPSISNGPTNRDE